LRDNFKIIYREYEVNAAPGQIIDYEVKDTKGHTLSKKEDISRGKFSFTSEVFDVYELCFKSKVPNSKQQFSLARRQTLSIMFIFPFRRKRTATRDSSECKERRGN
jgi:hypothetical protein